MVKPVEEMTRYLEKQGATVKKTKKGIIVTTPQGWTTLHFTLSNHRSRLRAISELRRIGLRHPEDKYVSKNKRPDLPDGYPSYVGGTLTKASREKFLAFLQERGWPIEVTVPELQDYGAQMVVAKCLYLTGYRYHSEKKKRNRSVIWVAPDDIVNLHNVARQRKVLDAVTPEAPDVGVKLREGLAEAPVVERPEFEMEPKVEVGRTRNCFEMEPEPSCGHDAWVEVGRTRKCADCGEHLEDLPEEESPEPELLDSTEERTDTVEPEAEDVDFIDDRDSWTVDPEELFGIYLNTQVKDRLAVLGAVGIEYEIRVWRKKES